MCFLDNSNSNDSDNRKNDFSNNKNSNKEQAFGEIKSALFQYLKQNTTINVNIHKIAHKLE